MKAAIFDMDGTLLDTMSVWRTVNLNFLREQGVDPTPQQEEDMLNLSGAMAIGYVKEHFGIEVEFEALMKHSISLIVPFYRSGAPHKPGALDYLKRLRARGVKTVLATATPAKDALLAVNQAGLTPHLDYIFSTEILGLSKGGPEFYDALCALIGEEKQDCVMFEDALYAMRGARAAGLGVIGVTDPTNMHDRPEIIAVCDRVIDSYDELC